MNRSAVSHAPTEAGALRLLDPDRPLRILLAEEDRQLRGLLGLALHLEGHDVVEAQDASELLEALAATLIEPGRLEFDLVICEQALPGIPGLSVLAGLRSRGRETGFVLITEHPTVSSRARRLGAEVLSPSFDVRTLRDAIRRLVARTPGP